MEVWNFEPPGEEWDALGGMAAGMARDGKEDVLGREGGENDVIGSQRTSADVRRMNHDHDRAQAAGGGGAEEDHDAMEH